MNAFYGKPGKWSLVPGDCLDIMRSLPEESFDSIVTDPPYGLGFMGKAWDELPPGEEWAKECLRLLKPGGHLLAFGGSRTWHRLMCAVEDAGFEIRDSIAWLYGSGFPKSLNVAKAIASGTGRPEDIRRLSMGEEYEPSGRGRVNYDHGSGSSMNGATTSIDLPPDAQRWQGWGTALKPAFEPIVVGRKPLVGTVAANVLEHGTGALNIDGCRTGTNERVNHAGGASSLQRVSRVEQGYRDTVTSSVGESTTVTGRWPTNVVLDDTQAAELDQQAGNRPGMRPGVLRRGATTGRSIGGDSAYGTAQPQNVTTGYDDDGGASRFFPVFKYQAKAPAKERPKVDGVSHPTVKPLELMRWLVRLVTPPGGLVLEPFAGSGTTLEAAVLEGFRAFGIEDHEEYIPLIQERMRREAS